MPLPPPPRLDLPRSIAEAPPLSLVDTVTGSAPLQSTTVRVAQTPDALHLNFDCCDRDPWATLTERDAPLYTEEVVEVFLDPAGDLMGYFEIEINPLGTVLDLVVRRHRRGLTKDPRWHCEGLEASTSRTDDGWCAKLLLPWSSLVSRPPRPGDQWRANFTRIDRPRGQPRELTAWSPTGVPLFHVPDRFGHLLFG